MSEIKEVLLSEESEFPSEFQGTWVGEEFDINGNLEMVEICGRMLKWCGRESDFALLSMHQNENGKIEAMQMECDPSHPDASNWTRYNIHFVIPQEDGESILIANSKMDSTLRKVSE